MGKAADVSCVCRGEWVQEKEANREKERVLGAFSPGAPSALRRALAAAARPGGYSTGIRGSVCTHTGDAEVFCSAWNSGARAVCRGCASARQIRAIVRAHGLATRADATERKGGAADGGGTDEEGGWVWRADEPLHLYLERLRGLPESTGVLRCVWVLLLSLSPCLPRSLPLSPRLVLLQTSVCSGRRHVLRLSLLRELSR